MHGHFCFAKSFKSFSRVVLFSKILYHVLANKDDYNILHGASLHSPDKPGPGKLLP